MPSLFEPKLIKQPTFINLYISRNPLLYGILAGQSSSGKLGGREVKTSALLSRGSWLRIPPKWRFFYRHSESTEYTVLYTRRCMAKLNQLFITRRKDFTNLLLQYIKGRLIPSVSFRVKLLHFVLSWVLRLTFKHATPVLFRQFSDIFAFFGKFIISF